MTTQPTIAGVILCGGRSVRMGRDKALLPFGDETMLERIVRLVGDVARPVIVVRAFDVAPFALPAGTSTFTLQTHDARSDRGPLEGLSAGLELAAEHAELALVTTCDAPLLQAVFVQRLVELLGDHECVVPQAGGRLHPLSAVYRTAVLPKLRTRLAGDLLKMTDFVESLDVRRVTVEELADADPQLASLRNINDAAEYEAALRAAGFAE